MVHLIAIEPNLTPVKDFLTDRGFKVENIDAHDNPLKSSGKYDAFVVNGLDINSFGYNNTTTKAVVINADGLTPEQVYQELKSRLE